jgi:hypothetical protein
MFDLVERTGGEREAALQQRFDVIFHTTAASSVHHRAACLTATV